MPIGKWKVVDKYGNINITEYKKTGRKIGAVAKDGFVSKSFGRGSCSGHGGVDYYLYETQPTATSKINKSLKKITKLPKEREKKLVKRQEQ